MEQNKNKHLKFEEVARDLSGQLKKFREVSKEERGKTKAVTDCIACGEMNFVTDAEEFETPLEIFYTENFTCKNCGNHTETITRITKIARGN